MHFRCRYEMKIRNDANFFYNGYDVINFSVVLNILGLCPIPNEPPYCLVRNSRVGLVPGDSWESPKRRLNHNLFRCKTLPAHFSTVTCYVVTLFVEVRLKAR